MKCVNDKKCIHIKLSLSFDINSSNCFPFNRDPPEMFQSVRIRDLVKCLVVDIFDMFIEIFLEAVVVVSGFCVHLLLI